MAVTCGGWAYLVDQGLRSNGHQVGLLASSSEWWAYTEDGDGERIHGAVDEPQPS